MDPSEFPTVPVDLAPAALVRRRGEQRRARARALVAGVGALVVIAGAGTTVALAGRDATPDSIRYAGTPTPTPTTSEGSPTPPAAPEMPRDPEITWAAFPSVTRMNELYAGEWMSGQVQVTEGIADADRCTGLSVSQTARAIVSRQLVTTDRQELVVFLAEDFASEAEAHAAFTGKVNAIRRCPTVTTDGPGAGSQETSTVLTSSSDAFTVRRVQRECQQDHADCKDSPDLGRTALTGHVLLSVRAYRSASPNMSPPSQLESFSTSDLTAFMDDFVQRVETTYGTAPLEVRPVALAAEVGGPYYAVFLWTGNLGQDNGMAQAQRRAVSWGNVTTTRLDCLELAARAVGRDYPGASLGDAVVMLFDSPQHAEQFVNAYDGPVEGVGRIAIRCLDAPRGPSPSPS